MELRWNFLVSIPIRAVLAPIPSQPVSADILVIDSPKVPFISLVVHVSSVSVKPDAST